MSRTTQDARRSITSILRAVASPQATSPLVLVRTAEGALRRVVVPPGGVGLGAAHVSLGPGGAVVSRVAADIVLVDGQRVSSSGGRLVTGGVLQVGRARWVALSGRETRAGHPYCDLAGLIGSDDATVAVLEQAALVARSDAPVLITGESGSGKEIAASAIHTLGGRAACPMVALNCAALPETLAEAELFGWARGAFSGATEARPGLFERADRGVMFLDEVGELSPAMQAKLLRVLDTGEVRRVGDRETRRVDVRIVSATHRDLAAAARSGAFRADLLYRLRVLHLAIPPLRSRPTDLGPLVERLLVRLGAPGMELTACALARLRAHRWPGNVRELRNVLQRAVVMAPGPLVEAADLVFDAPTAAEPPASWRGGRPSDARIVEELERQGGHRQRAYEALNISRSSFYRWLQRNRCALADAGLDRADGRTVRAVGAC